MIINEARKWIGYLEHQNTDLLGVYTTNVGKGGCTIFAEIIVKYYRWRNFMHMPWCATFIHAVFLEAVGKDVARKLLGKPHPGTRVMSRRFSRKGMLHTHGYIPSRGDIIFLTNGDGLISHCGIVERVDEDVVYSIEGNTIDMSKNSVFEPEQGGAVVERVRKLNDKSIVAYGEVHALLV